MRTMCIHIGGEKNFQHMCTNNNNNNSLFSKNKKKKKEEKQLAYINEYKQTKKAK